ncbi:retropepsin-like aspartic protease [Nostoc sp. NIES-2111]
MRIILPSLFLVLMLACSSERDRRAFENNRQGNGGSLETGSPSGQSSGITGREDSPRVQGRVVLPYEEEGGSMIVQATVNGTPCRFVFDTGADDVCISLTEARHMFKNKFLTQEDFLGSEYYRDASGDINEGMSINLREVRIGSVVLRNIKATIVKNEEASNLLGKSALEKFGKVVIDQDRHEIILIGD